ncbi:hypothetical protein ACPCTH_23495 [Streptomyces cellulosae]
MSGRRPLPLIGCVPPPGYWALPQRSSRTPGPSGKSAGRAARIELAFPAGQLALLDDQHTDAAVTMDDPDAGQDEDYGIEQVANGWLRQH